MAITDWPDDERPRARLLAQGTASRSDAEVLAILLRVDSRGRRAVDLARQPIARFGALTRLLAAGQVLAVLRTLGRSPRAGETRGTISSTRLHSKLGYLPPNVYEHQMAEQQPIPVSEIT